MKQKIKIFRSTPYASLPQKGSTHAVGFDLRADLSSLAYKDFQKQKKMLDFKEFLNQFFIVLPPQEVKVLPTGLKLELGKDMELDIKSRSGLFSKKGILVQGTIDPDYRGEIRIMMMNLGKKGVEIRHGERLAQGVFRKVYNQDNLFIEVQDESELSLTSRNQKGFGSTGIK